MKTSLQNSYIPISIPVSLILCLVLFSFKNIQAESNDIESTAQELSDQIMSPYCPGRTLSACPSDDARKLRQQITHQLTQGYSKDAVKRQLIGIYGKDILGEPAYKGFGVLAWCLPIFIVIAALLITLVFIKTNKSSKIIGDKLDFNNLESKLNKKVNQK